MRRNLFLTKTGLPATIAALAGFIVAIAPFVGNIWVRSTADPIAIANRQDVIQILILTFGTLSGGGGIMALKGRAQVTPEGAETNAPKFLRGPNKEQPPTDWGKPSQ